MREIFLAFAVTLMTAGIASAEERQARIEVSGLWCPSCSYIVGEAFQKSASVEILDFEEHDSGESGVYTITFDDALTTLDEIVAQPAAYGYSAVLLDDASRS
ncbi:periplasmic mercury ion-binding protein [uncultured Maritimibacter sp.]|jgi:mercuric ion binding protein|uniref:periplasmic mercury ion-binding protein n=1 Tax=uncultured Maritimibacter sp. TaxID=991866 RepID=UPI000B19B892|nr:periplasmic mercury ion-binding protein [uncultured Maritimibacter sp.]